MSDQSSRRGLRFGALALALLLTACGGGDDAPPSNPNQAPSAHAGLDRTVNEGTVVQLDGSASNDPNGAITRYQWTQTAGPAVALTNADAAVASFTAPATASDLTLTFALEVTDAPGATDTDDVTITVVAVTVAPVAANDSAATSEDTPVDVDVLANDTAGDAQIEPSSVTVTAMQNGVATADAATGRVRFVPHANFSGVASFRYTMRDVSGAQSNAATATISVAAVNDAPVAADDAASTAEDTAVTIAVLANDSDIDDALDPSSVTLGAITNGTAVVNPASGAVTFTPAPEFAGTASFTYQVRDASGAQSNAAAVTITVAAANDAPTLAPIADQVTDEDTETGPIALTIDDAETDPASLTLAVAVSGTADATYTLGGSGANRTLTLQPAANGNGVSTVTVTVSDGELSASRAFTFTVNAVNDTPTISTIADTTVVEDSNVTVEFTIGGADNDPAGLTVQADPADDVLVPPAGVALGGSGANRTLTLTPAADAHGATRVVVGVQDGSGTPVETSFLLTVESLNDAPQAFDDGVITDEDTVVVIDVLANDVDNDSALDPASVTIRAESHGVASVNADGTVTFLADTNFYGEASFSYTVRDVDGAESNVATVAVRVEPVNDAPVASAASFGMDEDAATPLTGQLAASDVEGDALTFALATPAQHGVATVAADGSFTYQPAVNFSGSDSFTFVARDASATSEPATVTVAVADKPEPVLDVTGWIGSEGAGNATFTIALSFAPDAAVVVSYETRDGIPAGAVAGRDYTATRGTHTFRRGEPTSVTVDVPITDDSADELDESFALVAEAVSGADGVQNATAEDLGVIQDNDADLLRVGAAKRSVAPSATHIAGAEETRVYADADGNVGTQKQQFGLGGYGLSDPQSLANPTAAHIGNGFANGNYTAVQEDGQPASTWVRALVVEQANGTKVAFVTLDAVGAGNIVQKHLKAAITAATGIAPENILSGQTHSHSAADLQGLWGGVPATWLDCDTTPAKQALDGCGENGWNAGLYQLAAAAVKEAYDNRKPADLQVATGTLDRNGRRTMQVTPDQSTDKAMTVLQARAAEGGDVIGTILQYAAHPVIIGDESRLVHADFVLGSVTRLERAGGGTALYYNGPIADTSPRGTDGRNCPAGEISGTAHSYCRARSYGEDLAEHALSLLQSRAQAVTPTLTADSREAVLPVTNPAFLAAGAGRMFNRYYNFVETPVDDVPQVAMVRNELPQVAPFASTTVSRVTLGNPSQDAGLEIVTIPGEGRNALGQLIRHLAYGEAKATKPMMLLGLTHNSFGYIIPEEEFGGAFHQGEVYEEIVSLGPLTAPLLRLQAYFPLFGVAPEAYAPHYVAECQQSPDSDACMLEILRYRITQPHPVTDVLDSVLDAVAAGCRDYLGDTPLAPLCGVTDALAGLFDDGAPVPDGGNDAALATAALDAAARGCDILDPSHCLLPFPSDHFTVPAADDSPQGVNRGGTGRRINFNTLAMPRNIVGRPIDPTEWNRNDGFSPGQQIIAYVPNVATVKDAAGNPTGPIVGAPPITNPGVSLDIEASSVVVIDTETGLPHPVWAEIDLNAGYLLPADKIDNPNPANVPKPSLIVRPAQNFVEGRRYVVVLKNLADDDSRAPIRAGRAFETCRDGRASALPPMQERCAALRERVFPVLEDVGIDVEDNAALFLAWDFTVASAENNVARLRHMRDDAFVNYLGQVERGDGSIAALGRAPSFKVTSVTESGSERTVQGSFTVPSYVVPADPSPLERERDVRQALKEQFPQFAAALDALNSVPRQAYSVSAPPNRLNYQPDASSADACEADAAQATGGCALQARYGDGLPDRTGEMITTFTCRLPRNASPATRPIVYGHGLLGGQEERGADHEYDMMYCKADWFGFAFGDVPNVATVLADMSNFPVVPDGSQQGMLNQLFLARLLRHPQGFIADPAFRKGGAPLFDNREVFYDGNSQGGILGGVVVAMSKDITRGVLGVVGMNYSTLLQRSVDYDGELEVGIPPYSMPTYLSYQDDLDRQLVFSIIQMLWDRSENNGYAHHMTDNSVLKGANKQVLLHPAFADHQVTHWSAHVMGRTVGVDLADMYPRKPGEGATYTFADKFEFFAQRDPDAPDFWGLPLVGRDAGVAYDSADCTGTGCRTTKSALVEFDEGRTAIPPIGNVPPRADDHDPHGYPRGTIFGRCQKSHFLHTQGRLIDVRGERNVTSAANCPALPPAVDPTEVGTAEPGFIDRVVAALQEFFAALGNGDPAGALAALEEAGSVVVAQVTGAVAGLTADSGPEGVWLRGDMHVHDDHSSDGSGMRQTLGQGAPGNVSIRDQVLFAQSQRLDFMALNDHRTFDQHYDPLWSADRLLLLTGEEANSSPHANVFGALDMINQADNPAGVPEFRMLQQSIWEAHAQGAAWSTNHPDDGEVATGADDRPVLDEHGGITPNAFASATGPDLVEVWNRGTLNGPKIAYAENRWNAGYRFGIAGASDSHFRELWAVAGPGTPMTHVLSAEQSTPALLQALRAGRSVINMGDRAPFVTLTGDFDGDGTFEAVGGDERLLAPGTDARLRVAVTHGIGTTVYVYRAPGRYAGARPHRIFKPTLPQENFDFAVSGDAGAAHDWYRVEVRGSSDPDAIDYKKVLAGEPQNSLDAEPTHPLRALTSPIFISATALAQPHSPELPADAGAPDDAQLLFGTAEDNAFAGFVDIAEDNGVVHAVAEVRSGNASHVVYRARLADGTLTEPRRLSSSDLARQPAIAARNGRVWAVWQESSSEMPHRSAIVARAGRDGLAWDDAGFQISDGTGRAQRPDVVLLDEETPAVVWEDNLGNGAFDVFAYVMHSGEGAVNVSAAGKPIEIGNGVDSRSAIYPASVSPRIAARADGTLAVVWQDNREDTDPGWTGHAVDPTNPDDLSQSFEEQELREAGTETDNWEILAVTRTAAGWSAPKNVSATSDRADRHATVAFDPAGKLQVAWDSKTLDPAGPRLEIRSAATSDLGSNWDRRSVTSAADTHSQRPVFGTHHGLPPVLLWTDGRSADWRWRIAHGSDAAAAGAYAFDGMVTGPGNATWPSYDNGWLAFTSDRSATREQRKPHQVFLRAVAPAGAPPATGSADFDFDGVPDAGDNCSRAANADQADADGDGVGDACESNGAASLPLCLGDTCLADLGEQGQLIQGLVDQIYGALVGGPAAQPIGVFQVGTGSADQNPRERVCFGSGSMCSRSADPTTEPDAIRDPLLARATAITGANRETFIVVATTNIGYFLAYKAEQSGMNGIYDVRLRIAQATGVPSTHVVVVSDHSHNGPDTIGIWGGVSANYMKLTADAVVSAAVQAWQSRRPAVIKVAGVNDNDTPVPGVPRLDSSYDLPPGNDLARGNPYNEFRLLVADDAVTGERILTFANYAPHATVTNGDKFAGKYRLTGDWASWMPQEAEAAYGGMGLATIATVGSTDWNKSGDIEQREAEARARLRRLMAVATAELQPVRGAGVQVASTFIREPLMQPALLLNYKPGIDHNRKGVTPVTDATAGKDLRIDRSILPPFMTGTVAGTYVNAIRLGDVFISTFPGEPFGELDHALADEGRVQGAREHFLLGGANDFFGYMVKNPETYEQTAKTGMFWVGGCPEEDFAKEIGLREEGEGACSDHWSLMVSPTFGSHIVCTLQDQADRLGFVTANRDAECPVLTALDGLGAPPESDNPAAMGSLEGRQAAVEQARALAEQCRDTAAPAQVCDALAAGAREAETYLGATPPPPTGTGTARAGVAVKDASWHLGASAGQFSDTGASIANDRGFDPYGHSTRKVGSDILGTRITTRALVVEGANGTRVAIASNDLYLPNDLLHRRVAQLLAEHDAQAAGAGGVVTGITDQNLATSSSHSHTSPFYSTPAWGTWIFQDVMDLRFFEYMARQMADAVIEAASTMTPVRMGGATVHANDIQAHTYGPKNVRDGTPAGQPRDYTTQAVTVVSFDDISTGTPKPLANWVTFGVHPEWVWGEEIVNGDITHAVMRMLDRETGATTVWSQRETGSSGPHKDERVHKAAARREFQESNFAGYDRAARYLTDSIKRGLGQLAAGTPERPDQFAPYQTGFDVAFASQRFAPPVTRPYPGVANCNTEDALGGHVGIPIVPEPPECGYETDALTKPLWSVLPADPAELARQLQQAGVPVPTSYGISSFSGVQETTAVHLQAFKLGTIAATMSPNEQFTSQALNIESRLDKVPDNLWHGFDWACVAQARGLYAADTDPKVAAHCARQNARYPETGFGIPGDVNDEDFPRARAQIHNDASGWELDLADAAQGGDTSSVETLGSEAEPADITQIKGNFTHEEFPQHGYDLVVSVGMVNDYWGYMAEYREYRAHSDPYRKGLNALGPHGADFVATRLTRMAANLNGAAVALPANPLDAAYQAESARADTFARTMGELARAYTTAYDATLPPDGGTPRIVVGGQPVDTVKRFSVATLQFVGGSNYTDMPYVRVERRVNGAWQTYGTQEGEVQLQLQFIPSLFSESGFGLPHPQALALWRAGQFEWVWTATFEAFISELDNLGGRPGITPAGTYRFVVDGQHRGLLSFPNATPYHIESESFEVVAWDGITAEDVRVENDGRVSFVVGPVNTFTTFKSGAGSGTTTRPGYTVGPVDYPDSYEGGISWIRNERQLFAGDEQYCGRCTFRPWADSAALAVDTIPVSVTNANGTYELTATLANGRWVTEGPIAVGDTAQVAARVIADEYGERNGAASAAVTRGVPPADGDQDGVPDAVDQCPTQPGPSSNNGCPVGPVDTDGDGVPDEADAFPNDPAETVDSDGDGTGNNADPDDDNDGVHDASDRFPFDPDEWADTDNDGVGDNADACPTTAGTGADGCPAALKHFVGSIHEHSGFSDGEVGTTPDDYFQAARRENVDFMASSEHSDNAMVPVTANADCLSFDFINCFQLSPEGVQKWAETAEIADGRNQPGVFTAIRGFEWTSDRFGHINVFFSQHDLNAKGSTGYSASMEDFWQWLALSPDQLGGADGLAVFNHPGREDDVHGPLTDAGAGDPAYAWNDLAYRPEHDARVVGIEMYGKKNDYYDGDNGAPAEGWYAHALGKGWHVAPVGAEDEHGTDWAKPVHAKTVILATENTRAALRAAMEQRRFYALARDHADIRIAYATGDHPMGSRLEQPAGSTLSFTVNVSDVDAGNGVAAARIQVVAPGAAPVTVPGLSHTFTAAATTTEQWRFVRVLDADGKVLAVSAPIWFKAPSAPPPVGGFPLCGDFQDETYCLSDLDEVIGLPIGSAIQGVVDTAYNTLTGGGGEPPPPASGANLVACALAQDQAQCEAALADLAAQLPACDYASLPDALVEALSGQSEGPILRYVGGPGNCAYEPVYDAVGVNTAVSLLHGLFLECYASPAQPACAAIRSTADATDAASLAVLSRPVPRGDLDYVEQDNVTPATRTINGRIDDWMGQGTRIGGTDIYEYGEHVYTDFLFDAFGADDGDDARRWVALALLGEASSRTERIDALQQAGGDQLGVPQPAGTTQDRYGDTADREDGTDLTEVRWAADTDDLHFLARVARLEDAANLRVLVLADTNGEAGMQGIDAGLTTAMFDRALLLAQGSAEVVNLVTGERTALATAGGAVAVSAAGYDNALEARIPRTLLERADGKMRVAVMTVRVNGTKLIPANVAYRFDEPVTIYSERSQALALFAGLIDSAFVQEIVIDDLVRGRTQTARPSFGYHERQFVSGDNISREGEVEDGRLQPYGVFVPSVVTGDALNPARLTFWTHYRGGKTHSGASWTPRLFWQLGEEQGNIVVSPRARHTSSWYTTRAHQDFFEVFADVAGTGALRQYAAENLPSDHAFTAQGLFTVDPARVYISGYSMGGFATYLFTGLYPDLFAAGYSTSGAVTQGAWTGLGPDESYCVEPSTGSETVCFVEANDSRANAQLNYRILDNTRHVPIAIHHGTNDELALTPGAARMGARLLELQYRYDATTFLGYEHFTQAIIDEWRDGAVFLNQYERPENPRTVTYKVVPALVEAVNEVQLKGWNDGQPFTFNPDGAYWVDGLVVRNPARVGDDFDPTAFGKIDATSEAIAAMDYVPVPRSGSYVHANTESPEQSTAYASTPVYSPGNHSTPYVRHGLEWLDTTPAPVANKFSATLTDLVAATLDLPRMKLRFDQPVEGDIVTDGATRLTLARAGADMTVCVNGAAAGDVLNGGNAVIELTDDASVRLLPGLGASCAAGGATPAATKPEVADVCASFGVAEAEPLCAQLRDAGAQLRAECEANSPLPASACTAAGGNLHALIDACYDGTGGNSAERRDGQRLAACRIADAVVTGVAAWCRQVSATLQDAQPPQVCALVGGVHVGEYEMQAYENSWIHRALRLQNRLGYDLPLIHTSVVATHNSFNATDDNTPPTLSGSDSNQLYTMTDQLRMGVRSLEIDVHWMPRRSADGTTLREPVVCHGTELQGVPHVGCTAEKPLRQVLAELRPWLDANPNEAVVVYIEDNLRHNGDDFDAALSGDGYESAGKVVDEVLGDIVWKPAATAAGATCQGTGGTFGQAGSWLNASRSEMVAAGKQLLLIADSCSDGAGPAWDAVMHWKNTGTNVLQGGSHRNGVSYPDQCVYSRAQYGRAFTRVWEDSTMVTASDVQDFPNVDATDKTGPITPAIARELMRCGMHMPGLDQLTPFDGRLAAMVWSWAPDEPSADAAKGCALHDADGRLVAAACPAADGRKYACVDAADPALWTFANAPGACARYSVPANGYANEKLKEAKAAAGLTEVWVNYRRDASAFEGWVSDHDDSGAGEPRNGGGEDDLLKLLSDWLDSVVAALLSLGDAVALAAGELAGGDGQGAFNALVNGAAQFVADLTDAIAEQLPGGGHTFASDCNDQSWVGGTTEICNGVLTYRDYVYDDHGADTQASYNSGGGTSLSAPPNGYLGPVAGDERYVSGQENTADFVKLTLAVSGGQVHIVAELNTLYATSDTKVAVALDTDNDAGTGGGAWTDGASTLQVSSAGWDEIHFLSSADVGANVVSGSFPLPAGSSWRVQAVAAQSTGRVMNVAFRGTEEEAQGLTSGGAVSGTWWEDKQAAALATGDISAFGHAVEVADLVGGVTRFDEIRPGLHQRVYTSQYTLKEGGGPTKQGEGISVGGVAGRDAKNNYPCEQLFHFLGKYQPYGIYIPSEPAEATDQYGVQLLLHGCAANHASLVNQRGMQLRFGEDLNRILVVPLGRGPVGFYSGISERDVLDVMDDVQRSYPVDQDKVFSGGYSMGGYGALRMATFYPDRFAGAVNWVGFTGDMFNAPPLGHPLAAGTDSGGFANSSIGADANMLDYLESLRHVPSANLYAGADELVTATTAAALLWAFESTDSIRDVPFKFYLHPAADHLTFAVLDDWRKEAVYSAAWTRVVNPARVTYSTDDRFDYDGSTPAKSPNYGIRHDRAYWLSGIRRAAGATGKMTIDLTSHGCADASVTLLEGGYDAGVDPVPWQGNFRERAGVQPLPRGNRLVGTVKGVGSVTIDASAACLGSGDVYYEITTTGSVTLQLSDGRSIVLEGAGVHAHAPPSPGDADADGVIDAADACAATPRGMIVAANGCSVAQRDGDGDGVIDGQDNCPLLANADQQDANGDGAGDACAGTDARFLPSVVVAISDTGVNPYHRIYYRPDLTRHPCTYLKGFDCSIPALNLSIGQHATWQEAFAADAAIWNSVVPHQWYWIPGTNIVGAVCFSAGGGGAVGQATNTLNPKLTCILDDSSNHGTGTSSAVLMESPDALLLIQEGDSGGYDFATAPVRADVQSHSWGPHAPLPLHTIQSERTPDPQHCALGQASAETLFFLAAGNEALFPAPADGTRFCPASIVVGGGTSEAGEVGSWTFYDFASWYCRPGARTQQLDGYVEYCGTSFSAPTAAGTAAAALLEIRRAEGYAGRSSRTTVSQSVTRDAFLYALRQAATYAPEATYANGNGYAPLPLAPGHEYLVWGWGFVDRQIVPNVVSCARGLGCPGKSAEATQWNQARDDLRRDMWQQMSESGLPPLP